jgi:ribosomal protein L7/L12
MTLSPAAAICVIALAMLIMILISVISARLNDIQRRVAVLTRIDAKLDLLLKQANIKYAPYQNVAPDIVEAVRTGQKIMAIKLYRQSTGAGLKESKDFVEELQRQTGLGG